MGSLDDLRARLAGLSEMLGQRDTVAVSITLPPGPEAASPPCSVPAAAPRRRRQFQPTVHPASAVLRSANSNARDAPLGGLLAKYRDAEAQWLKVRHGRAGWQQADGLKACLPQHLAFGHFESVCSANDYVLPCGRRRASCSWS